MCILFNDFFLCLVNFCNFFKFMPPMFLRCYAVRTNKNLIAIFALKFAYFVWMRFTFRINEGRSSIMESGHFMFFVFPWYVIYYTGLTKVDMTKSQWLHVCVMAVWHKSHRGTSWALKWRSMVFLYRKITLNRWNDNKICILKVNRQHLHTPCFYFYTRGQTVKRAYLSKIKMF